MVQLWKTNQHFLKDLKQTSLLWASHSTCRHLSKKNECVWPHRFVHKSAVFIIGKNWKQSKCVPTDKFVVKSYKGILFSNKKEQPIDICNVTDSQYNYGKITKAEKSDISITYSMYLKVCKMQIFRNQIRDCLENWARERWIVKRQKEIFVGDRYVRYLDCGDSFMIMHTYFRTYQIMYLNICNLL